MYILHVCLLFMEVIRGPSGTVVKDGCELLYGRELGSEGEIAARAASALSSPKKLFRFCKR